MSAAEEWYEGEEEFLDIGLTGPQDDFVYCPDKYPAIIGGLGSGKTQGGTSRATMLMGYEEGCDIGYYMPTYDLITLRAMPGVEEFCTLADIPFKTNKSKYLIDIEDLGTIIFRSYEKPERIIAYEVAHSIVDELDTLNKEKAKKVWKKVKERNRAACSWPAGNTIANVTTPDMGTSGFSYSRWGEGKRIRGYTLINAPTMSNVFLGNGTLADREEYVAAIREEYDPLTAEAMIEGKFVNLTANKVYHFYDRKKHHTRRRLKQKDMMMHVSIDFNIGGCCAVVWVEEDLVSYAVDEFVSHDTMDFCLRLEEYNKPGRKIYVYPDATGSKETTNATESDISIIRKNGFGVKVNPGNPAVRDRINAVNGGFSHNRIMVNSDLCPRFSDALESQGWDENGKPEKFKEHPSIDDWTDSGGYYVNQRMPVNKSVIMTNIGMSR